MEQVIYIYMYESICNGTSYIYIYMYESICNVDSTITSNDDSRVLSITLFH